MTVEFVLFIAILGFFFNMVTLWSITQLQKNQEKINSHVWKRLNYLEVGLSYHGLIPMPWEAEDMEDIVEELLGEIEDEHDVEDLLEKQLGENHWLVSARHEVEYLNEKLNIQLQTDDAYETLGGLILDNAAEIPEEGKELEIDGFYIKILKVETNRIDLIELKLL